MGGSTGLVGEGLRAYPLRILKVRSATLDTWLPEQVAFIQSMGNEKSNIYWEAELPPNYDRVGIENFIRAKYEEKRWVPRDGRQKSPSKAFEERSSVHSQRPGDRGGNGPTNVAVHASGERRNLPPPTKTSIPARNISVPAPSKVSSQVSSDPKPAAVAKKPEPIVQNESTTKEVANSTLAPPPKIDYATDLFNMLSMGGPTAESASSVKKESAAKQTETESQQPQKDLKSDIMSLFEKSKMASPFSVHQQQLAVLAQQQSLLMAAAAKSNGGAPAAPAPGGRMPVAGQNELQMQMGNVRPSNSSGIYVPFQTPSIYNMETVAPVNGIASGSGVSRPPAMPPASSLTPTRTETDFDFSSLTQGMFSKS
ncbi:hypothetical protein IFM89_027009 [Coptis chinensis]|uniref:Arf-GAP domain-containing protein n=1 Tax=Coptis chinensis TaxID=261450 RepID=A0A835H151_9MAGN|nr:hypothetical protein IFM89_027009 [Coptis chinensis]